MTCEDIIRMAREAGFTDSNPISPIIARHSNGSWVDVSGNLERFAELVAAAEREACADVVAGIAAGLSYPSHGHAIAMQAIAAIRAKE